MGQHGNKYEVWEKVKKSTIRIINETYSKILLLRRPRFLFSSGKAEKDFQDNLIGHAPKQEGPRKDLALIRDLEKIALHKTKLKKCREGDSTMWV